VQLSTATGRDHRTRLAPKAYVHVAVGRVLTRRVVSTAHLEEGTYISGGGRPSLCSPRLPPSLIDAVGQFEQLPGCWGPCNAGQSGLWCDKVSCIGHACCSLECCCGHRCVALGLAGGLVAISVKSLHRVSCPAAGVEGFPSTAVTANVWGAMCTDRKGHQSAPAHVCNAGPRLAGRGEHTPVATCKLWPVMHSFSPA
jgi:hypothetical protein